MYKDNVVFIVCWYIFWGMVYDLQYWVLFLWMFPSF
jgi:hypothetical protein